ncbi:5168_t:CDS:2 [Diversispora eburnea]|uniref:5168_t:CDS:1 n=1 Tax=Diversispora eburnea TaxID=1213867 RepID=A0A9N8WIQ2_9GLOM|nr:5168_t:CDS:2 [Diversispora eburnea]
MIQFRERKPYIEALSFTESVDCVLRDNLCKITETNEKRILNKHNWVFFAAQEKYHVLQPGNYCWKLELVLPGTLIETIEQCNRKLLHDKKIIQYSGNILVVMNDFEAFRNDYVGINNSHKTFHGPILILDIFRRKNQIVGNFNECWHPDPSQRPTI